MTSGEDEAIRTVFLAETRDALDAVEGLLPRLEADPGDRAALDAAFRCFHTIKGTAGFLGLTPVVSLAHSAEDVLGDMRDTDGPPDPAAAGTLAGATAGLRALLGAGAGAGPDGGRVAGEVLVPLARLARRLAAASGKAVAVRVEGAATVVDRGVVEGLAGPLVHLLRNAVDHGIESPAERARAGKPGRATVTLRVRRERDHIHVEVADDGPGVDVDQVRSRAGLPASGAVRTAEGDPLQLIFRAGLTTAATVTGTAGRGVGLDAVRTGVARLGGTVEVSSRRGAGSTFRIRLPAPAPDRRVSGR